MLTYWEEHVLQFIIKNQDKLYFGNLSSNSIVTWNIIQAIPDKNWNWCNISRNPNITWDIIQSNPDKNWNWYYISLNKFKLEKKLFQEHIESLNKLVIND
jgi:hypothetical protein